MELQCFDLWYQATTVSFCPFRSMRLVHTVAQSRIKWQVVSLFSATSQLSLKSPTISPHFSELERPEWRTPVTRASIPHSTQALFKTPWQPFSSVGKDREAPLPRKHHLRPPPHRQQNPPLSDPPAHSTSVQMAMTVTALPMALHSFRMDHHLRHRLELRLGPLILSIISPELSSVKRSCPMSRVGNWISSVKCVLP